MTMELMKEEMKLLSKKVGELIWTWATVVEKFKLMGSVMAFEHFKHFKHIGMIRLLSSWFVPVRIHVLSKMVYLYKTWSFSQNCAYVLVDYSRYAVYNLRVKTALPSCQKRGYTSYYVSANEICREQEQRPRALEWNERALSRQKDNARVVCHCSRGTRHPSRVPRLERVSAPNRGQKNWYFAMRKDSWFDREMRFLVRTSLLNSLPLLRLWRR